MAFDCSVVIPTFNRARMIGATIEAVLRQNLRPSEIIVVDDGSVDDTASVVTGYAPHVSYLRGENQGPPAARNRGLAAARMPWIALCDSDDLWGSDHLAAIARLARAAPEVQYVFTNFTRFTDGVWASRTIFDELPPLFWPAARRELFPGGWVLDEPLYPKILGESQPILPSTTAFTREHLDRVGGFDEGLNRNPSEDFEFTLRSVREAPIGVLTQPGVGIRRHRDNFSADWLRAILASISVLRLALENHSIPEDWRSLLREQIIARSMSAVDDAFGRQDFAALRSPALDPAELSARHRLKTAIARLPEPVAKSAARVLLGIANITRG